MLLEIWTSVSHNMAQLCVRRHIILYYTRFIMKYEWGKQILNFEAWRGPRLNNLVVFHKGPGRALSQLIDDELKLCIRQSNVDMSWQLWLCSQVKEANKKKTSSFKWRYETWSICESKTSILYRNSGVQRGKREGQRIRYYHWCDIIQKEEWK